MKKFVQISINMRVIDELENLQAAIDKNGLNYVGQLRSCNATVFETKGYYVLRSYNTIVAAIEKGDNFGFDFLRYVYGFTSTSAQHIAKFFNDYGKKCGGMHGVCYIYRYYPL